MRFWREEEPSKALEVECKELRERDEYEQNTLYEFNAQLRGILFSQRNRTKNPQTYREI